MLLPRENFIRRTRGRFQDPSRALIPYSSRAGISPHRHPRQIAFFMLSRLLEIRLRPRRAYPRHT